MREMGVPVYRRVLGSEPGRYVLAGGVAFGCDISVLFLLTDLASVHYLISNALGYATGLCVSYWLNVKWVFSYRRIPRVGVEFAIFNLIVLAGLLLNELLMYLLVDQASLHYLTAKIFAAAAIVLFNYLAKKFILFHPFGN